MLQKQNSKEGFNPKQEDLNTSSDIQIRKNKYSLICTLERPKFPRPKTRNWKQFFFTLMKAID